MQSVMDEVSITVCGPTVAVAQVHALLVAAGIPLALSCGEGLDTGVAGVAVVAWRGRRAPARPFGVRGPRSGRKGRR